MKHERQGQQEKHEGLGQEEELEGQVQEAKREGQGQEEEHVHEHVCLAEEHKMVVQFQAEEHVECSRQ